jgi:glycosyltransferase involved in cell wall biosynthesis
MENLADQKIAIVADWLTSRGGAERVVLSLAKLFPTADIFTTVFKSENFPELKNRRVIPSYLQNWPLAFKHQVYLWARPLAIESLNLDDYDLVISSASAEAKGIITKPETLHICYCHTPTRYFWSHYHEYLKSSEFGLFDPIIKLFVPGMIHKLRMWDRVAADRVDFFIANSDTTAKRIKKYYSTESRIINPPVDLQRFAGNSIAGEYYLVIGRQIAYKRTDLVVEAFNQLDRPLKIIGDGPELSKLKSMAKSSNIEFLGFVSDEEAAKQLLGCKALIFPQEEDFGIVPVEAMAAGKPVVAYGIGGGGESVIDGTTGVLFFEQSPTALIEAINRLENLSISSEACRNRAEKFGEGEFHQQILTAIKDFSEEYKKRMNLS